MRNTKPSVASILQEAGATSIGPGLWRLSNDSAPNRPIEIQLAGDCLELRSAPWLRGRITESGILKANALLGGLAKLVPMRGARLEWRAELLLDEPLRRRLGEALAGFSVLSGVLAAAHGAAGASCPADTRRPDAERFAERLRRRGWTVHDRGARQLVEAGPPESGARVALSATSAGCRLEAMMRSLDGLEPLCVKAVARLLIRQSSALRMLRPVLREDDGAVHAVHEVLFESEPSDAELESALNALTWAMETGTDEARCLCSRPLAELCLSMEDEDWAPTGTQDAQPGGIKKGGRHGRKETERRSERRQPAATLPRL